MLNAAQPSTSMNWNNAQHSHGGNGVNRVKMSICGLVLQRQTKNLIKVFFSCINFNPNSFFSTNRKNMFGNQQS